MARFKLIIEYDGTPFAGWQRQANGPSVQAAIEAAIAGFSGEDVRVHGAGRTDAGVHARAMAAHVDLGKDYDPFVVSEAINFYLRPNPVAVLSAERAGDDFHARFSCTARHYEYVIKNRRAPLTFEKHHAWRIGSKLDDVKMHEAAQCLAGRNDFTTFRAAACQADSPIKTLFAVHVTRDGDNIRLRFSARSFLHNQVRSMVGSLVEVGKGKWEAGDVERALLARDRKCCGPVAPPCGLYFLKADYENNP